MRYVIKIRGMPTPRPRAGKWGVYSPPTYKNYLESLVQAIEELDIPKEDYSSLQAAFYFEYPKSTPKKSRIDLDTHRNKFDGDNLIKGLMDALTYAEVLRDDSQLYGVCVSKFYTTEESRIEFELDVS